MDATHRARRRGRRVKKATSRSGQNAGHLSLNCPTTQSGLKRRLKRMRPEWLLFNLSLYSPLLLELRSEEKVKPHARGQRDQGTTADSKGVGSLKGTASESRNPACHRLRPVTGDAARKTRGSGRCHEPEARPACLPSSRTRLA